MIAAAIVAVDGRVLLVFGPITAGLGGENGELGSLSQNSPTCAKTRESDGHKIRNNNQFNFNFTLLISFEVMFDFDFFHS